MELKLLKILKNIFRKRKNKKYKTAYEMGKMNIPFFIKFSALAIIFLE